MGIVETAVRKTAEVLGLESLLDQSDAERVEKFRKAQAEAAKIPALENELREIGVRLLAARAALAAGQLFEGGDSRFWVAELESDYHGVAMRLSTARQAEVSLVGLCPDRELQGQRRDLIETRKATLARMDELRRRRQRIEGDIRRIEQDTAGDRAPSERVRIADQYRDAHDDLQRVDAELAGLEADRQQLDVDLESVRSAMRSHRA